MVVMTMVVTKRIPGNGDGHNVLWARDGVRSASRLSEVLDVK